MCVDVYELLYILLESVNLLCLNDDSVDQLSLQKISGKSHSS